MGLENIPEKGKSTIYDDEGATSVPKDIREVDPLNLGRGDELIWVKNSDEDFARVYSAGQEIKEDDGN